MNEIQPIKRENDDLSTRDYLKFAILVIVKEDNDISWKKSTAENDSKYIWNSKALVKDSGTILCKDCEKPLRDLKDDEKWYCWTKQHLYMCSYCFSERKPLIIELYEKECDLQRKMPTLLSKVENDIKTHRNYENLDLKIRQDFEGILAVQSFEKRKKRRPDDAKDLRLIWSHLYHGKEYNPSR
jgi:hypothetical protein